MSTIKTPGLWGRLYAKFKSWPFAGRVAAQTVFELGLPALVAVPLWYATRAPDAKPDALWTVYLTVGFGFAAVLRIWHKQSQSEEFRSVRSIVEGYATGGPSRPKISVAMGSTSSTLLFVIENRGPYPLQSVEVKIFRHPLIGASTPLVATARFARLEPKQIQPVGTPVDGLQPGQHRFFCLVTARNGSFGFWVLTSHDGSQPHMLPPHAIQELGSDEDPDVDPNFPGLDPNNPKALFLNVT